ncbi:MAG: Ig-like domain-containing protein [Candidatus Contendobacter sp.]|jgi:hypothetical protein|nr:hypothetical protein [Gammaproteobacteria bacterium]MCC8993776.1 Ig-like domain-containing protein [Candidatus Contendobacter sp.]
MNSFKLNKLSVMTLTVGAVLIAALPVQAGDIVFSVEEPVANNTYSGVANLRGWAVSSAGISQVELYVDDAQGTNIPMGGQRSDVGSAYPNYPNSSNSGFSMAFNYSNLSTGPHRFRLRVVDRENATQEQSVDFNVVRFNTPYIADPAKISLAGATGSLNGRSIVLNKMTADGQAYDIQLDWRTEVQGFVITRIVPAGSPPENNFGGVYRSRVSLSSNSCAFSINSQTESELKLTQTGSQMNGTESGSLSVAGTVDALGSFSLVSARLVQNPTANCRAESYFNYQGSFPSQTVAITINYEYFGSCQYSNCNARFQGSINKDSGVDDSSSAAVKATTSADKSLLDLGENFR